MAEKETATMKPGEKRVAGYRLSIIGKDRHKVGNKTFERGKHYSMADLGGKVDTSALVADPHIVIEALDKDGNRVLPKPGEAVEDEGGL